VLVLISIFTQFLIFEERFSDNFEALDTDNRLGMVWHMKHHRLSVLLMFLIFFLNIVGGALSGAPYGGCGR
jgi:hypothetical protein